MTAKPALHVTGKQLHDQHIPALSEQCSRWTDHGRCRNKVATMAAKPGPGQIALCRKHADIYATSILTEYAPLIWALQWTGKDSA